MSIPHTKTLEERQAEMRERAKAKRKKLRRLTPRMRQKFIAQQTSRGESAGIEPGQKTIEVAGKIISTTPTLVKNPLKRLPAPSSPDSSKAYRTFEREFGRDSIINVLSLAQDQDRRMGELLTLMLDPSEAGSSFATLCLRTNLTLFDFLEFAKKAHTAVAIAEATKHAPAIMHDIALDAMSRMGKCADCDGTGQIEPKDGGKNGRSCPNCEGKGTVRFSGDKAARDQFLEATGIIQRKGGVSATFNLQNINNNMPGLNPFESTIARAHKVLDE